MKQLIDPDFLKLREAIRCGESIAVDPDYKAADQDDESSTAGRRQRAKSTKKQKPATLRRHLRRVAAGITSP